MTFVSRLVVFGTVGLQVVGFVICYLVTTLVLGFVIPPIPTISEIGNTPPASSVFTFCLGTGAFGFVWCFFVRFKDVHQTIVVERYRNINRLAFACALGIAVCMVGVASFQISSVRFAHYAFAICLFALTSLYMWLMALVSSKMSVFRPSVSSAVIRLRFVLAAIETVAFIVAFVFALLWYTQNDMYWWNFVAVSEYVMAASLGFYVLTFDAEFRNFHIHFNIEEARYEALNDTARILA